MPLSRRVGDAVVGICRINTVGIITLHQSLIEGVIGMITCSIVAHLEVPRTSTSLGIILHLSPAVVRHKTILVDTQLARHIGSVTCEEEGTTSLIVVSQHSLCGKSLRSSLLESFLTVHSTVFVEVPPYHLTLAQVYIAILDISKRSIDRVVHIREHPLAGCLLLWSQFVHRQCQAGEYSSWLAYLLDGYGISACSRIVGDGIGHWLGEVDRCTRYRCDSSILAHRDGRNQLGDVHRLWHINGNGLVALVDGTSIDTIHLERENLCLIALGNECPVEEHISILHAQGLCKEHIHLVAHLGITHSTIAEREFAQGHLTDVVGLRHTYGNGACSLVYSSFIVVECQLCDRAASCELQVGHIVLAAGCEGKNAHQ